MSVMRKTDILLQWDNEKRSSPGPSVKRFRVPLFGQRGGYILDFLHLFFSDRFLHEVDLSCNSGSDGGGDIGPWLSCWCHCGKSNMPRDPAPSLSQLLLIGSYYLEQDLNILQIHLQSSTCAGYLKYEFWDLLLEIPGQLLFLTSNTGTDRTTLSPAWTSII